MNVTILEPHKAASIAASGLAMAAAFPIANLLDPAPKLVARTTGVGASWQIDLDYGADVLMDCLYFGFGNFSAGATWQASVATNAAPGAFGNWMATRTMRPPGSLGPRHEAFWVASSAVGRRYVRITVNDASNPNGYNEGGVLFAGKAFTPTWNHEWESGRTVLDPSPVIALPGGDLTTDARAIGRSWRFALGDLTDAEGEALFALLERVGFSQPVVVLEDPDHAQFAARGCHYGQFTDAIEMTRRGVERRAVELTVRRRL